MSLQLKAADDCCIKKYVKVSLYFNLRYEFHGRMMDLKKGGNTEMKETLQKFYFPYHKKKKKVKPKNNMKCSENIFYLRKNRTKKTFKKIIISFFPMLFGAVKTRQLLEVEIL